MDAFAKMPIWLFHYPIKPNSKIIYCYLLNQSNIVRSRTISLSTNNLSKEVAMDIKTARKALNELEQKGLIKVSKASRTGIPTIEIQDSFLLSSQTRLGGKLGENSPLREDVLKEDFPKPYPYLPQALREDFPKSLREDVPKPIHYKKEYKKNIKRTSTRTRACARERKTYDTNLFRNKDSFPEEKEG